MELSLVGLGVCDLVQLMSYGSLLPMSPEDSSHSSHSKTKVSSSVVEISVARVSKLV